ncbi:MAG: hypothetical protein KTR16_11655 [Acidiferrobacterales bacterium]|nr:hypothetical protein [Acidiferrobacterales bacterium]
MANPYYFETDEGDTFIPVADGSHELEDMSSSYETGQCYVQFFDASKEPVEPTGGTITFISGPFSDQWLESSNRILTIDADSVKKSPDVANYTAPQFDGCVVHTKMTLSGITGATYVKAFHWRA